MKLFVYHTPELLPQQGRPQCAIAIDVLRASTTITTALNSGAEAIQVFSDIDELFAASEEFPEEKRLRAGERGGKKIAKCDLGNSPLDCTPKNVEGKRLFLSTTNGTRCLESIQKISTVLVAALINRQAVVDYLLKKKPGKVWLVGSGWEGEYSLEDTICAGAIADGVLEQSKSTLSKIAGNDELIAAVSLYRQWKDQLQEVMALSSHGQRLNRLRGQKDIAYCCELDTVDLLPVQKQLGVIVVRQPGFFEKLFSGGLFGGGKKQKPQAKSLKDAAVQDEPKVLPAAKARKAQSEKPSQQKGKAVAASAKPEANAKPKADAKPKASTRKALKSAGSPPQAVAKASNGKVDKTKAEQSKIAKQAKPAETEKVKVQKAQAEAAAKAEQAKKAEAEKAKAEAQAKAEAEKAKAEKAKAEKAKAEAEKVKAEAQAKAEAEKAKAEKAKAEKAKAEAEKAKAGATTTPAKAEPEKAPAKPVNTAVKAEEKPVKSAESKPSSTTASAASPPAPKQEPDTGNGTTAASSTAKSDAAEQPVTTSPSSATKPAPAKSPAKNDTSPSPKPSEPEAAEKEAFKLPTLKGFTDRLGRLGK